MSSVFISISIGLLSLDRGWLIIWINSVYELSQYSRDSMIIYLLPSCPIFNNLIFTLLNSYDLKNEKIGEKSVLEFINDIMGELSLVDENISSITFNFTTRFESTRKPEDQLTKLLQKNFMNKLKDATLSKLLKVMSIRLGDSFSINKEGFNIVFEPLISKPDKVFFYAIYKKNHRQRVII